MNRIHNKQGPEFDVGALLTARPRDGTERRPRDGTERRPRDGTERRPRDGTERRPRDGTERRPRDGTDRRPCDGTERRPRDGTERRPRDGTERRPRDGTERRPRDEVMLWMDSKVIRYYYRITGRPQNVRIHGRPCSKRRKPECGKPALGPVRERYALLGMKN
jgi:hypothetical protein